MCRSQDRLKVMPPPRREVAVRVRDALNIAPSMSDANLLSNTLTLQSQPTMPGPSDLDTLCPDPVSALEHHLLRQMLAPLPTGGNTAGQFKLSLFDGTGVNEDDPNEARRGSVDDSKCVLLEVGVDGYAAKLAAAGLWDAADDEDHDEDDLLAMMDAAVA